MKTVYFVRHGESEGNTRLEFQGPNTKLTERGQRQAVDVAERCAKLPVEAFITSNTERTIQTAATIGERIGKSAEVSDLFRERERPSTLQHRLRGDPEAEELNAEWLQSFYTDGHRVLDGESLADVFERASKALAFLEAREEEHILVVSHGFSLRALLGCIVLGPNAQPADFRHLAAVFHLENTGISVFRHKPGSDLQQWGVETPWRLWVWNDHAHLG